MVDTLVYSEIPEVAQELVTAATKLAGKVSCVVIRQEDRSKLSVNGVSTLYEFQKPEELVSELVVDALEQAYKEAGNSPIVLLGGTKSGREIAPRLATRLGIGCISDAQKIQVQNGSVSAERLVWGGNAIATVSSKKPSVVITIPVRAYERATGTSSPEVKKLELNQKTKFNKKVLSLKEKEKGNVNIKDANVVVSAGRGFKKKEDLAMLEELAGVLGGVVGASRPLTSDYGWMPEERQVGLSGVSVKPKLYLAVGISGQIQHLTGMRDSKIVAAINSDRNAPIFSECDYGIVGDLYAVVPELTKALNERLSKH